MLCVTGCKMTVPCCIAAQAVVLGRAIASSDRAIEPREVEEDGYRRQVIADDADRLDP